MTKELKIIPPEGFEIDKENSTFEHIKFKPIVKRWRDHTFKRFEGYFINSNGKIMKGDCFCKTLCNCNVFATEKQAKSAFAMAQISQINANDDRFGGPVTDEEWMNYDIIKWVIDRNENKIIIASLLHTYKFLAFHTQKQRDLFLEENEDLVKDYLMI